MKIYSLPVSDYETNCYIVEDETTKNAVVIDPGAEEDFILRTLKDEGLTAKLILLTHGHFDHTGAVRPLHEATGAPVWIHEKDVADNLSGTSLKDIANFYDEGDTVTMDSLTFKVMNTPGHTPGSCVLLCDNVMFAGDTLFAGSCGRTDFPGGSWQQMCASLKRLAEMEGDWRVLPGHMNATSLSRERRINPFVIEALNQ